MSWVRGDSTGDNSEAKLVHDIAVKPHKDHGSTREFESVALQSLKAMGKIKFSRGLIVGLGHKSPSLPSR
jgi:hypothetical protein